MNRANCGALDPNFTAMRISFGASVCSRWRLIGGSLVELLDGDLALPLGPDDLGDCVEGDERRGERRGMDDHAWMPLREDRVVLVLAFLGVALPPALQQAVDVLVAEVPAAIALAQAAAERAHVADLRPGDLRGGTCQRRVGREQPALGDVDELRAGTDGDRSARTRRAGRSS